METKTKIEKMIDEYGLVSLMDYHIKWQGVLRYSWTKQQKEQQADWTDGKRTEQNISVRKHCFSPRQPLLDSGP